MSNLPPEKMTARIIPGVTGAGHMSSDEDTIHQINSVFAKIADGPRFISTPVKFANYATDFNELVLCDISGGAFNVTLPEVTADNAGNVVMVKNTTGSAAHAINVVPFGTQKIDQAASLAVTGAFAAQMLVATFEGGLLNGWAAAPFS